MRSQIFLLPVLCWLIAPTALVAQPPSETKLFQEADARIKKHRQADAIVLVVDAAGKPIPGATCNIEQSRHAFLFGCNIFLWGRVGSPQDEATYRSKFAEVFNCATLPFYWASYERQKGKTDRERIEQIARWCHEHGITTIGHPLAWNHADPYWLPPDLDEVRTLQLARVKDCASQFKGLIDIWDVVNEPTHFDREEFKKGSPKLTAMWAKTGRVEFVRQCLQQARSADTPALLRVNDYRTDEAFAKVLAELAEGQKKPPFDVIGIQSHMHGGTWSNTRIWEVCERFARFGVPMQFSETTILGGTRGWELTKKGKPWPSKSGDEQYQAAEVERFYTMIFSHPKVVALTWWDFSDRGAWQRAPAGFLRADMTPKPAYETLHKLVKERWWTKTTAKTDDRGESNFRGFLGEYKVVINIPQGKQIEARFTLVKDQPNRVTVKVP